MKRFTLLLLMFITLLDIGYGQRTPCDTTSPNPAKMAEIDDALKSIQTPQQALTWDLPVRVTVCYKDDGTGYPFPADEALLDDFLTDLNAKLAGGGNSFNFFRCGSINEVNIDEFYNGSQDIFDYSYAPNYFNLYVTFKNIGNAQTNPPWVAGELANTIFFPRGPLTFNDGSSSAHHEFGHALGLFHTFQTNGGYIIPATPAQADYPYSPGGGSTIGRRELMIDDFDQTKTYKDPNNEKAGDGIADTPPGCDDNYAANFPSSATIGGCLDTDPNTPCINGCNDNDPLTPCLTGCMWDYNTCEYIGDYRDYNLDLIEDPLNILPKNYMSYTGVCRESFTLGQKNRANLITEFYHYQHMRPNLCGSLEGKVAIKDTDDGLGRVSVKIQNLIGGNPVNSYSRCVTNPEGGFTGQLQNTTATIQITADNKLLGSNPDFTYTDDDWLKGVTTLDLITIRKHVLGISPMDGYGQIAADVNKSGTVTTYDELLVRKLILGVNQTFPAFDQPWAFIPEVVTIDKYTQQTHADFNGGGDDNPFDIEVVHENGFTENVQGAPYIDPAWQYFMNAWSTRKGFDAMKLGNVKGIYPEIGDPCPHGNVVMVVPNAPIVMGEEFDLKVKGFNFSNVGAFQIGMSALLGDFEYVSSEASGLTTFEEEEGVGGLKYGDDGIKLLWISNDLTPFSMLDGSELFNIRLRAKKNILNLQQLIYLDDEVLQSLFYTTDGDCIDNVSLELNVDVVGVEGRSSSVSQETSGESQSGNLFCYPNPASKGFDIVYDAKSDFAGTIRFSNIYGRIFETKSFDFKEGRNILKVDDLQNLPNGIVNVSVIGSDRAKTTRVVIN